MTPKAAESPEAMHAIDCCVRPFMNIWSTKRSGDGHTRNLGNGEKVPLAPTPSTPPL